MKSVCGLAPGQDRCKGGKCTCFNIYLIEIPGRSFFYSKDVSHDVVSMFSIIMSTDAKWRGMFQSEALSSFLLMSLKF